MRRLNDKKGSEIIVPCDWMKLPTLCQHRQKNFPPGGLGKQIIHSAYSVGSCLTFHACTNDNLSISASIIKEISSRRSRTLLVTILNEASILESFPWLTSDTLVVAKIYDPRYYTVRGDEWTGSSSTYMKYLYNNEVTAYRRIASLQGEIVPSFRGEFAYHPATGEVVDLILLEYISAPPFQSIDCLGRDERKRLKEQSDTFLDVLRSCSVSHNDLCRENLLWDSRTGLWVLDFDDATFDDELGFVRDETYIRLLVTPLEELRTAAANALATACLSVESG